MSITQNAKAEISLTTALTIIGVAMTTSAELVHMGLLIAPGALLITVGGAWLGNAMARHGIRLIPSSTQQGEGE